MASYFLAPHVYVCEIRGTAVLLDLRSQRYLGINARQVPLLRRIVRDWPGLGADVDRESTAVSTEAMQLGATFLRRGLLSKDPSSRHETAPPLPVLEIRPADILSARATPAHLARLYAAWIYASYQLGARRLERTVRRVQSRKALWAKNGRADRNDAERVYELASIFCKLRPLVFATREACLLDSLTLIEFLAQYGHFPVWIIAVSCPRFTAHSWVQLDQTVLNDSVDRTATYRPILAI